MPENDCMDDGTNAQIAGVKILLAEAEAENRWLRGLLTAAIVVLMCLVWRYS